MMHLCYETTTLETNISSILQFVPETGDSEWIQGLYHFYPEIRHEELQSLQGNARYAHLTRILSEIYQEKAPVMAKKKALYQAQWDRYCDQITAALSDAFAMDCGKRFQNMVGRITLNPVCPRYLETQSFDVFYLNSERGALGMALHEIIHFVWFDVWQRHFQDDLLNYERPHLKWILSEMAVETFMREPRLAAINPYFEADYAKAAQSGGCVYDCFYRMTIKEKPILQTLHEMRKQTDICAFMETAYDFCRENEEDIRGQMKTYL